MRALLCLAAATCTLLLATQAAAQAPAPSVVDPDLEVATITTGLNQPVQMEWIGKDDFLVLEKPSGQVKRVRDGGAPEVVLDLTVNSASERGLLGIALDKHFRQNGFVYLFWSETTLPVDNNQLLTVPTNGNRLDRFHWDGSTLTFDKTLVRMRSFQNDESNGVARGNHNGGVVRVGPDGKVYLIVGDTGRRGQLQNLIDGPFVYPFPMTTDDDVIGDDQFGGPDPDTAHLTGVILRLNPDGSAPKDNPFFDEGAERGGQVGASLRKLYAYGIRNSFGMAFDPFSGDLWEQENGDDSFSEINRVRPGFNSGWVQVMGPLSRVAQFREIENNRGPTGDPAADSYYGLQQVRWGRRTSRRRPARPPGGCSGSPARSSATRSCRGSTSSPPAASTSSRSASSASATAATCSSAPRTSAGTTSSACRSTATAGRSTRTTGACATASPTTSASTT